MCILDRDTKDPSTFSNFDEAKISHIDLDWEIVFDKQIIRGAAFLGITVLKDNVNKVILDCRDLVINKVFYEDKELEFSMSKHGALGDACHINTPVFHQGEQYVLQIVYETSDRASALQFLDKNLTADKELPFLYSQCQAIHARSIAPTMDTPAVKQTYSARVRVPRGFTCLMSAVANDKNEFLPKEVVHGCSKLGVHYEPYLTGDAVDTFYFIQRIPIPSYLIAIVSAKLARREISERCAIWAEPSLVDTAANEFSDTEIMLKTAEDLMGEYRWGRYDLVVLPSSFPFGGMENPCLTFVTPTIIAGDKSLTNVIAHEISHSWTGNLVTNFNWEHFWLNEGFTVFVERKIMGRIYGEDLRQFENICGWEDRLIPTINETFHPAHEYTKLNPNLDGVDPDDSYSTIPYEKGSALLLFLEQLLDDTPRFEDFLKSYIAKFALQSIVTNDWKKYLYEYFADKKEVLDSVNWHGWFKEPGIPPNKPKFSEDYIKECRRLFDLWTRGTDAEIDAEPVETFSELTSVMKVKVLDSIESANPLSADRVSKLENKYGLTKYGNCEIVFSFLLIVLKAKYEPLIDFALDFACQNGRLKYVKPIYVKLFKWNLTRDRAIERYEKNISIMHPITAQVIKTVLDATPVE